MHVNRVLLLFFLLVVIVNDFSNLLGVFRHSSHVICVLDKYF